jgi:hypothetical protein
MRNISARFKTIALLTLFVHCFSFTSMWAARPMGHSLIHGSPINPSFESGSFAGYTSLDEISPDGGPPPPPPINEVTTVLGCQVQDLSMKKEDVALTSTDGDFFAVLHTVRHPYRLRQSIVIQDSFTITATHLQIDLDFLSNEIDTGAATNDSALVYLTIEETGQIIPVAFFSRDQLQPAGAGKPSLQAVRGVGGFKLSTGWSMHEIDLSKYVGMSGFLTFNVRKAAPVLNFQSQDTALAIDAVRLSN